MKKRHTIGLFAGCCLAGSLIASPADNDHRFEYRVLATKKTSTMEKELNAAGTEGFRFEGIMVAILNGADRKLLLWCRGTWSRKASEL
jgi:hypothetical protein